MAISNKMKRTPVKEQEPKVRATNFNEVCLGYDNESAILEVWMYDIL